MKKWLRDIRLYGRKVRHSVVESVTRWLVGQLIRLERAVQRTRLRHDMPPVVNMEPEGEEALEGRYSWHER